MSYSRFALGALVVVGAIYFSCRTSSEATNEGKNDKVVKATPVDANLASAPGTGGPNGAASGKAGATEGATAAKLAPHVEHALDWLAGAQQKDGGWGAGSSSRQEVRDAHAVPTDPATTAVAAIAVLRAGNSLDHGAYAETLRRATEYLLRAVETAKDEGPQITDQTGTQPQAKMGQNVDTALTAQYLARLAQSLASDAGMRPRVEKALDKCLRKIESSQSKDGSWAAGGWAPVLQSAQMSTALEFGQNAGREIDVGKLYQARDYQRGQAEASAARPAGAAVPSLGRRAPLGAGGGGVADVRVDAAAGVPLYASAANMRGVAAEAKAVEEMVDAAKQKGELPKDAKVDAESLQHLGVTKARSEDLVQSFTMNRTAKVRAFDENVLDGFGNNGGEEFLSYQMKSEALVIDGGEEWTKWSAKMNERLAKVQNKDGSWSGHHCITSPAFCTATAISCLTAERDVEWLGKAGKLAGK
ncbi:MAG TPA: prenyltransferase/squalene oxidase repeat-containing protein [Planctomycetota bacterium]